VCTTTILKLFALSGFIMNKQYKNYITDGESGRGESDNFDEGRHWRNFNYFNSAALLGLSQVLIAGLTSMYLLN
jgi:hypothetical protein